MNILLIAGHGAGDPGATSKINGVTYKEADETRKLVALVAAELKRYNVTVGIYNTDRNAYKDCAAGKLAVAVKDYDYVGEFHFNALKAKGADGRTTGFEVYVPTSERGVGVELQVGQRLAALGLTNRGVKRKDFAVIKTIKKAGVSAALFEVCFIDDPDDMKIYTQNRQKVARAIADGIAAGFGIDARKRTYRDIVQTEAGLADSTMDYLSRYKYGSELLRKLAQAIEK